MGRAEIEILRGLEGEMGREELLLLLLVLLLLVLLVLLVVVLLLLLVLVVLRRLRLRLGLCLLPVALFHAELRFLYSSSLFSLSFSLFRRRFPVNFFFFFAASFLSPDRQA